MSDIQNEEPETAGQLRTQFESTLATKDREIALLKAGVDTSTPLGQLFADGYKGEATAEAIKEAWTAIQGSAMPPPAPDPAAAPGSAPPAAPAPTPTQNDLAVFDEAGKLIGGTPPTGLEGPVPQQASVDAYWQAKREGRTDKDAEAIGLDKLFNAANQGDPRALVPGGRRGSDD